MLAMHVYCLLFLAVTSQVAFVAADECFDNMDSCLKDLRGLMTSTDAFWFGTAYQEKCGSGIPSTGCRNPHPGLSILQRFLNTTGDTPGVADTLQMVDVVYSTPAGSYYGCNTEKYAPPIYDHRINPLKITEVNGWSLEFTPSITWKPKDDSTLYTVLVWDVGYLFLHGFYINAAGGKLDSGIPVVPYHGPRNPAMTANLFLFIVIEQQVYADPATVGMTNGALVAANEFMFHPTLLLAAIPNTWTVPVAVNLMSVRGDIYSVEWHKQQYTINNCAVLLSQEPALHTVLTEAEIPVMWSYEMSNGSPRAPLYTEKAPYLKSLSVDLNLEYWSDKLTIESCCVKSSYIENMYRVSPYQESYPVVTRDEPRVEMSPIDILNSWNSRPGDKHFTLVMVDVTDAAYMRADKNFNIHWLVTDIHDADVKTGNVILPYAGPNPFDRYSNRIYLFLLLEQNTASLVFNPSDYVSDNCPDFLKGRCGGQIGAMVKDLDLKLVGLNWFAVSQDEYARKNIYERFVVQPMVNVCDGLPGFEDPCPRYEICSSHASALASSMGIVLLVVVSMMSKLL